MTVVFETLAFLRAHIAGAVCEPGTSNVLPFQPGQPAMLSTFYQNDVLAVFRPVHALVVTEETFLRPFGIPTDIDLASVWLARTVDAESGKTVIFQQTIFHPRDAGGHDV